MKVYFENVSRELTSLTALAEELSFVLAEEKDADVKVKVSHTEEDALEVALDGGAASIAYGGGLCRFNRALGLLFEAIAANEKTFSKKETPSFKKNGFYLDVSRNAVMRPKTVKEMMKKVALMGMNTFWLYMEDMYEIDGEPYFGHMRGRYTKAELKEL